MTEVGGWIVRGRPRLRSMDGAKAALGRRGMMVEVEQL